MDQVGPGPYIQSMKRKGNAFLGMHRSWQAQGQWNHLDRRQISGGIEVQGKVLGGWNIVQKNVDVELHLEDEYGVVEVKDIYNQMKYSEQF